MGNPIPDKCALIWWVRPVMIRISNRDSLVGIRCFINLTSLMTCFDPAVVFETGITLFLLGSFRR